MRKTLTSSTQKTRNEQLGEMQKFEADISSIDRKVIQTAFLQIMP